MVVDKNVLKTVDLGYKNMVNLTNGEHLTYNVPYKMVSDKDVMIPFAGHIYFKAGVVIEISGLLAEKILLYAQDKGLPIRLFDNDAQKVRTALDQIEQTKKDVEALQAQIKEKEGIDVEIEAKAVELPLEEVKEPVIKTRIAKKKTKKAKK